MILLVTLGTLSCYPLMTNVHKKPDTNNYEFEIVQIPDFKKTDEEWVPYDSNIVIPDMLAEKLQNEGSYKFVDRSTTEYQTNDKVLLVKGYVTGFEKGCKYCEWIFLGINDKGKNTTSVWIQLVDKSNGELISDFGVHGRAKDPGHGNSRYIRVVDEITRVIKEIE